jgi:hypothetical protein
MAKEESYNNLIDLCIVMEENPDLAGNAPAMFGALMSGYFFRKECEDSKNFGLFIGDFDPPPFLQEKTSLFDIDTADLERFVNGQTINESLAGRIMLSPQYLKAFYSNHPPSFSKLPEDIKFELIDRVKEKNATIIGAYEKMIEDCKADRKRSVLTLVALIVKNIHKKTGKPFNHLDMSADALIRDIFRKADSLFTAAETQVADLRDETKIKELIKKFFIIRQFKDISELAAVYKSELERYIKRGRRASA